MEMQDLIEAGAGSACLRVGPFRESDAPAFAAAVRESADTMAHWMPWCHADYSEDEALAWIKLCAQHVREESAFDLGIYNADRSQLYGSVAINQINRMHNYGNIGYWVRSSRQRQGIATRAVRVIAAFGFHRLMLARLEILAVLDNEPSRGVALKAGARFEGFARKRLVLRGVAYNAALHALTAEDLGAQS